MEYDDRFDATLTNDIDNNDATLIEMKKHFDKRYHVFNKQVALKDSRRKKNIKIELYGSGDTGSTIRDAETGKYYQSHLVGSSNEDFYFKVSYSMANSDAGYRDPLILFYQSPEHYERHQYVNLDEIVKQKWHKKNLELRKL